MMHAPFFRARNGRYYKISDIRSCELDGQGRPTSAVLADGQEVEVEPENGFRYEMMNAHRGDAVTAPPGFYVVTMKESFPVVAFQGGTPIPIHWTYGGLLDKRRGLQGPDGRVWDEFEEFSRPLSYPDAQAWRIQVAREWIADNGSDPEDLAERYNLPMQELVGVSMQAWNEDRSRRYGAAGSGGGRL